jgi:hypothetical protein
MIHILPDILFLQQGGHLFNNTGCSETPPPPLPPGERGSETVQEQEAPDRLEQIRKL